MFWVFFIWWQETFTVHQAANTSEHWAGLLQLQHQLQKDRWSCAASPATPTSCREAQQHQSWQLQLGWLHWGGHPTQLSCTKPVSGVCAMQLLITVIEDDQLLSASLQEDCTFQHMWDLYFCKEIPGIPKVKMLCPQGWVSATGNIFDLSFLYVLVNFYQLSPSIASVWYLYL